ncbi:MAG: peptidylprolyl isomerase [Gemmatimonadales bacterium]|nr:peptidylprolyl isomerase [Gemmatimonadales bacterium]
MRAIPRSIRSPLFLAALVLAAACGKDAVPQDALDATVVQVGDAKLTGKVLQQWLLKSPVAPVASTASILVGSWLDAALLQQSKVTGLSLNDSALTDAAIGPDAARGMILEFWAGRANARPAPTDGQADSLAKADNVRVLQHFFLAIPRGADSMTVVGVANRARAILERAKTEDFTKLVREASEDSATRASDGFLPAVAREDVPQQIRAVAWSLEEGAVSRIIPSPIGLHIVRRATLAESRRGLKRWLAPRYSRRADSTYVDSLARAAQMVIAEDARERVRAMLHEPLRVGGGGPLVTWTGGALTPDLAHDWIVMIPSTERATLAVASDSALTSFLREMMQRELILARAGASHQVGAKARGLLAPQYHTAVAEVLTEFGSRTAGVPAALAPSVFIDSLVLGRSRYRPLPGALSGVLRSKFEVSIDTASISKVLKSTQTLWAELHANDTTTTQPGTPQAPGVTPPAGAPPVTAPTVGVPKRP